jgi:hypothetical protein
LPATIIRKPPSATTAPSPIPSRIFLRAWSEAVCCGISCGRATGPDPHVAGRTSALPVSRFPFPAPAARLATPRVEIGGTRLVAAAGRRAQSRLKNALVLMTRTSPRVGPFDGNRDQRAAKLAEESLDILSAPACPLARQLSGVDRPGGKPRAAWRCAPAGTR